jgi:hypothetical protein
MKLFFRDPRTKEIKSMMNKNELNFPIVYLIKRHILPYLEESAYQRLNWMPFNQLPDEMVD